MPKEIERYEAKDNLYANASRVRFGWWRWELGALMESGEQILAKGHALTSWRAERKVDRAWDRFSR